MSFKASRYIQDQQLQDQYFDLVQRFYKDSPIFESAYAEIIAQCSAKNPSGKRQQKRSIIMHNDQDECIAHCTITQDRREEQGIAWFGFFECIQDQTVFDQFWSEIIALCKERGITKLKGPINGTIWNPYRCTSKDNGLVSALGGEMLCQPYYHSYFEQIASEKIEYYSARRTDYSGLITITKPFYTKATKDGFRIERIESPVTQDMQAVMQLALEIFQTSWGFVPLQVEEFFYVYGAQKISKLDALYLLYDSKTPIGFAVCFAETEQILNLKTIGVLAQYQGKGLGNALVHRIHTDAQKSGYSEVLYALIRAENKVKNLPQDDAEIIREYRGYEMEV